MRGNDKDLVHELVPEALHDLNNSLTNLSICLAEAKCSGSAGVPAIDAATSSSFELIQIVNNLYSELRGELTAEKFRPESVLSQVLDSTTQLAKAADIDIRYRLVSSECLLLGDRVLFYRMLHNLLMNSISAVQKSDKRLREICLTFGVETNQANKANESSSVLVVVIRDSGVGMPRSRVKEMSRLLNSQTKPILRSKSDGIESGMGIKLIARAISRFSGQAYVESKPGIYTKIVVKLPCSST